MHLIRGIGIHICAHIFAYLNTDLIMWMSMYFDRVMIVIIPGIHIPGSVPGVFQCQLLPFIITEWCLLGCTRCAPSFSFVFEHVHTFGPFT